MKQRRPLWLWAFVLWLFSLAAISLWRGVTFWRYRSLFSELASTVPSGVATAFAFLFAMYGVALLTSAAGLLWRRRRARWPARVALPLYLATVQAYHWGFVRTGLLRERRWLSLTTGLVALAAGTAILWGNALDKTNTSEDNYGVRQADRDGAEGRVGRRGGAHCPPARQGQTDRP